MGFAWVDSCTVSSSLKPDSTWIVWYCNMSHNISINKGILELRFTFRLNIVTNKTIACSVYQSQKNPRTKAERTK